MNNLIIYELYIKSFKDSNDDGIGDLGGVLEKLEYLSSLGVNTIWLTPIFPSPQVDNGYDVANYVEIAKEYGSIDDFKKLCEVAKKLKLKVVIDVVFNHCSDQHKWFKDRDKKDYFVWSKEIPNNWVSMFSGSAWEFDARYGEYYLHRFAKEQPDLNYTNPKVVEEVKKVLRFWIGLGVDGFRFDVINFLFSDKKKLLENNPENEHVEDINHEPTYKIIREINRYLKKVSTKEIIMIGEVGSEDNNVLRSYIGPELMDFVFNFNIASIKKLDVRHLFEELQKTIREFEWPTIFFSSHDMSRFANRLCNGDVRLVKVFLSLMYTFKGIPILFQGDEIGQDDIVAKNIEQMVDIQGVNEYYEQLKKGVALETAFELAKKKCRDYSRGTMHWNEDKNKGFSNGVPWIYQSSDEGSVAQQEKNKDSVLNYTKAMIKMKSDSQVLISGEIRNLELIGDCICYQRWLGDEVIEVILNFSDKRESIEYQNEKRVMAGYEVKIS